MSEILKLSEAIDWYRDAYFQYLPDNMDDDDLEEIVIKSFNIDSNKLQKERYEKIYGKEQRHYSHSRGGRAGSAWPTPQQIALKRKLIIKRLQAAGININDKGKRM